MRIIEPKEEAKKNNIKIESPSKEKTEDVKHLGKKEKIINAENFKKIKTIHPHEIIKIEESNPKEIKEGEKINFN